MREWDLILKSETEQNFPIGTSLRGPPTDLSTPVPAVIPAIIDDTGLKLIIIPNRYIFHKLCQLRISPCGSVRIVHLYPMVRHCGLLFSLPYICWTELPPTTASWWFPIQKFRLRRTPLFLFSLPPRYFWSTALLVLFLLPPCYIPLAWTGDGRCF